MIWFLEKLPYSLPYSYRVTAQLNCFVDNEMKAMGGSSRKPEPQLGDRSMGAHSHHPRWPFVPLQPLLCPGSLLLDSNDISPLLSLELRLVVPYQSSVPS